MLATVSFNVCVDSCTLTFQLCFIVSRSCCYLTDDVCIKYSISSSSSSSSMSGLLFENDKHAIAKVRENANRHGGKNATVTK